MKAKGRTREASLIRNANVASAIGRLLLGEISSWHEYLEPDLVNYQELPRRQLKSGKKDVQSSLQSRIDGFCKSNFLKMTRPKLVSLYEEVKLTRGLEIPYVEFTKKYSPILNFSEKGYPPHSTVCISLWGMQYKFPEQEFTNDLIIALEQHAKNVTKLNNYEHLNHADLEREKENIASLLKNDSCAKRQLMQSCFSLLECFLNSMAWCYYNETDKNGMSNTVEKILKDMSNVTLRDKLIKYPRIIFEKELESEICSFILDDAKKYRDSLMHPSPFSAPERFGGYSKLDKLYNLDKEIISTTVFSIINVVEKLVCMGGQAYTNPVWLPDLKAAANKALNKDVFFNG